MSIILISTFVAYRLVVDDSVAILLMVILMLCIESHLAFKLILKPRH